MQQHWLEAHILVRLSNGCQTTFSRHAEGMKTMGRHSDLQLFIAFERKINRNGCAVQNFDGFFSHP